MTSQEVKNRVLYNFLFEKGWAGGFTESFWNSDVLGLTKQLFTVEAEVKVNKGDLQGEIDIIRKTLAGQKTSKSWSKTFKHQCFLGKRNLQNRVAMNLPVSQIPNQYYFAVTDELAQVALIGTVNTPYGVLLVTPFNVSVIKKAVLLHKNPLPTQDVLGLMRKVSIENYYVYEKLVKARRELIKYETNSHTT